MPQRTLPPSNKLSEIIKNPDADSHNNVRVFRKYSTLTDIPAGFVGYADVNDTGILYRCDGTANSAIAKSGDFAAPGAIGATTPGTIAATSITATTSILSSGATLGVGYTTGAGGQVTQATSKSTGVTLDKVTGQITLNNAALLNATAVSFTLTNSAIAATDVVAVSISSGATAGAYLITVDATAAGSALITLYNRSIGVLGEALVVNFAVFKGSSN